MSSPNPVTSTPTPDTNASLEKYQEPVEDQTVVEVSMEEEVEDTTGVTDVSSTPVEDLTPRQ